jgi:trigger factor
MKNKHEISVKIEGKEWEKALDKSFNKNVAKVKVDGFRVGKCPKDIYIKKFGIESLFMDAVDFVIEDGYRKVIEDNKLEPIIQPKVDIKSIDKDSVELVFSITTAPEVKIKKYKGLKVEKEKVSVTKKEIEEEIENLRKQYAEIVIKDGKIENGDTAVIDFEGFKDGVAFQGGKGENYPLEIGSKTFIPGFEEQLIGLKQNDEKEIKVTFPEDYPSEDLKGKEVTFKIKVHEVKTKKIPELNEEFFLDLGMESVKTEEDLKEKMKEDLMKVKEEKAENEYVEKLLEEISKNVEVEIPDELVDNELDRMIEQYEERLKMQGISLDQYLQFTKSSRKDLKEKMREDAHKNVLYRMFIEEIIKLEDIKVEDKEVEEELEKLAKDYQMEKEELLKAMGGSDYIKYDLTMRKTIEFIKENNKNE